MSVMPSSTPLSDDIWNELRRRLDPLNPVDYGQMPVGPNHWVIDKNAEMVLAKEDDCSFVLTSLRTFIDEVTIEIAAQLDRDVESADFLPGAVRIIDTDTYAQVATFGMAGWLDDIDWDAATIERVRIGLQQAGHAGHVEHFETGLTDLGHHAERLIALDIDREALAAGLIAREVETGWVNLYCALDASYDLSRACAMMALRGTQAHHTQLDAIYEAVGTRLAASHELTNTTQTTW